MLTYRTQRCRDGYHLVKEDGIDCIQAVSGNFEGITPIPQHKTLFRKFADIGSPTTETVPDFSKGKSSLASNLNIGGILNFAGSHGLLTNAKPSEAEQLDLWNTALSNMSVAVRCWQSQEYETLVDYFDRDMIARSSRKLVLNPSDQAPKMEEASPTLLDAMWGQFALAVAQMETHLQCYLCREWFVPKRARSDGPIFCTPKCQKAHAHRRKKEKTT
jgi:hypothetical protein